MGKLLATILVLVTLVGGGVFYLNSQSKPAPISSEPTQNVAQTTPTPSATVLVTTDASIDSDMTALDKDLAGLQQSDTALTRDVNGL